MASLFQDYLDDFERSAAALKARVEEMEGNGQAAQDQKAKIKTEAAVKQLERALNMIRMEVHSQGGSARALYGADIRRCESTLEDLKRRWLLIGAVAGANGAARPKGIHGGISESERQLLQLRSSERLAHDSEQAGIQAVRDLHGQRETIGRIRDSTREWGRNVEESNVLINKMSNWWNSFLG
eukprot:GHVT01012880.1.p1 GENE.GHVT01012880.1~~GHVT01012880.1.p1  ORF type:complete len:183 (-),score=34.08 GHVT01012880.1:2130-2678(-)